MRKSAALTIFCVMAVGIANAQSLFSDSVLLQEVEINVKRAEENPAGSNQVLLDSAILSSPSSGNLGKVLAENSGIFVKTYGQGALASVSFRGSGASHTGVYWNGFSLNSAMNGMVDLSLLPIAFYDQVEIDYGNSSIEKGAGGLGGSIDLRSQPNFQEKLRLNVHQSIGSYGHFGTFAKMGIGNKKWHSMSRLYRQSARNDFHYKNLGKEGFPREKQRNAEVQQEGLMQSIYFRPNDKNLLKLEAWYLNSDRQIPSIMTVGNKGEVQKDEAVRVLVSGKHYFGKGSVEVAGNYQHEYLNYSNKMLAQSSKTSTVNFQNRADAEYRFSSNLKLKAQLQISTEFLNNASYSTNKNQWRQSSYLSAAYKLRKFDVEVFAREEWLKERQVHLLPGAAVRYALDENSRWQIGGSIAKNVKYPTLNDMYWLPAGNPDLQSEESTNMEIQLSRIDPIINSRWTSAFTLTVFHYNIHNYIQWQPTAFGYWRARNLKEIKSQGVELYGQIQYAANGTSLKLRGSYSYTSSVNTKALNEKVNDESIGKQLFYVPEHLWNIHLKVERRKYWLQLGQHFTGYRYTTSDNSDFLPSFSLLNIKLGKTWIFGKHRGSIEFSVENVLDKEYQAIQWRPMPGRNYFATIKYLLVK